MYAWTDLGEEISTKFRFEGSTDVIQGSSPLASEPHYLHRQPNFLGRPVEPVYIFVLFILAITELLFRRLGTPKITNAPQAKKKRTEEHLSFEM